MEKKLHIPFETTLQVRDTCLCLHVQRAGRSLGRRFDDALRPHGLTNGQFSLLMSLNRPKPAAMGKVADILGMDRTTLSAALKPLQRRGLIVIATDPADRRGRLLSLTLSGSKHLAAALPTWTCLHGEIEAELTGSPERLRKNLRALSGQS